MSSSIRIASSSPAARLTVDLGNLVANWRSLQALASGAETAAVVKANAYGLGVEEVIPALSAAGCTSFFVALPEEGIRVRTHNPSAAIYVLNGFADGSAATYGKHRLRPVLGSLEDVEAWLSQAGDNAEPVALHVDTGLNRLGFPQEEASALSRDGDRLARLRPALLMSHFACADTPDHAMNRHQMERFEGVRALFPDLPASLANSAGILLGKKAHHDVVRPGIGLYGAALTGAPSSALRPVVTLESRVIQIRALRAGDCVGYGASFRATRPTRIAIIATGYADGYHRLSGPGGHAAFAGKQLPIVGRISMDLMAVDIGGLPGKALRRGDYVELIGETISLEAAAEAARSISYEILTALGHRYERHFIR